MSRRIRVLASAWVLFCSSLSVEAKQLTMWAAVENIHADGVEACQLDECFFLSKTAYPEILNLAPGQDLILVMESSALGQAHLHPIAKRATQKKKLELQRALAGIQKESGAESRNGKAKNGRGTEKQ